MNEDVSTSNSKKNTNAYTQPLVLALLAGVFGFVYSYYYHGELLRALGMGGLTWLLIFWVVLRGNNIVKRRESKPKVTPTTLTANSTKQH